MYANFPTVSFSHMEDKHRCLFHNDMCRKKKSHETTEKQLKMLLPTSPKVELGKNCAMLKVYDEASRVRKIKTDTTN